MKTLFIALALITLACQEENIKPVEPKSISPELETALRLKDGIEKSNSIVRSVNEGRLISDDACARAAYSYQQYYKNYILLSALGWDTSRLVEHLLSIQKTLIICYYENK